MLTYTPSIGESGTVTLVHHADWAAAVYVDGVGDVISGADTVYYELVYSYNKTGATSITLAFVSASIISGTGPYKGDPTGLLTYSPTDTLTLVNNAGTIEVSGDLSGENDTQSSPPNVTYGGYNDPGSWESSFEWYADEIVSSNTNRFWVNDDADNDSNNPNNWAGLSGGVGGAGVPNSDIDVFFDSNSGAEDITFSVSLTAKTVTMYSGYTGDLDSNGNVLQTAGNCYLESSGSITLDSGYNMSGNGTFKIGANLTAFNTTGGNLTFYGNCTILNNYQNELSVEYIKGGAAGKTLTISSAFMGVGYYSKWEIMSATGAFLMQCSIGSKSTTPFVNTNGSITMSSSWYFDLRPQAGVTTTFKMPATSSTIPVKIVTDTAGIATISLGSNTTVSSFEAQVGAFGRHYIFQNPSNYNLTAAAGYIKFEATLFNAYMQVNGGSGNFTAATDIIIGSTRNATSSFTAGTGTWTCGRNCTVTWTQGTFSAGASLFKFNGASAMALTTAGKTFYDVLEDAAGTLTLQDDLTCNSLDVQNGSFDSNTKDMNIATDIDYVCNDDVTVDSDVSFGGDLTIGSSLNSFSHTGNMEADGTGIQQITFGGESLDVLKTTNTAGKLQILDASHCGRYDFAPDTTIEFKEGVNHTLDSYSAGDIDGTSGNLVTLKSMSPGTPWNFINPASMVVSYVDVADSNATNEVDASDGTNVDSTGNTNWLFAAAFLAAWAVNSNRILINGELQ